MKHLRILAFLLPLVYLPGFIHAQDLSNFRQKTLPIDRDTILLDTLSIAPGSFQLKRGMQVIPDSLYSIDYWNSLLLPTDDMKSQYKLVTATYRVLPPSFSKSYFQKNTPDKYLIPDQVFTYEKINSLKKITSRRNFNAGGIIQSGSIARGLTVGNNQDVSVNSTLNLQLSGKLSENLNVTGVISDDNIPLQPDGTTQEIRQLDKVFLTIYNDQTRLTGGDFSLENQTGEFMKFNKKVQGAKIRHQYKINDELNLTSSVSGSVARGKFCIQSIDGQEGNQGPYRLTGCENETQVIVLAGSEKVYIDGKRMKRGKENDYIINYNTAELTFTANQPITKNKRIKVEFEYAIRSYARFSIYTGNKIKTKKGQFWINYFSETDAKNQTLAQDLNESQKQILANAGDSTQNAVVPYVDTASFSAERILYKQTDTTVNGTAYPVYVYSTNPDSAKYEVGFSYVGPNKGNYTIARSAANGRIFKWLAPKNGIPQGEYSPIRKLIAPVKHQMIQMGGHTHINESLSTRFEFAFSDYDKNRFSKFDQGDNKGYAARIGLDKSFHFTDTTEHILKANFFYRGIHKNFQQTERIRSIEFERDWNLRNQNIFANEHLIRGQISYNRKKILKTRYQFETLQFINAYEGYKNELTTIFRNKGYTADLKGNILHTHQRNGLSTEFIRYRSTLSKDIHAWTFGVKAHGEQNLWHITETDSLNRNSFAFHAWQLFFSSADTTTNNLTVSYERRNDLGPREENLSRVSTSEDINVEYTIQSFQNHMVRSNITYRELDIEDTTLTEEEPENNLIGRLEHRGRWLNQLFTTSTFWEIGSGLEPKKEFTYLEVPTGQGVYTWSDYNENEIRELNEFEQANYRDEANFIRIYRPSSEYIKTHHTEINQMVRISPKQVIKSQTGIPGFLKKFSHQVAFNLRRKTQDSDLWENANLLNNQFADSSIISQNSSFRNKLSFNQQNPVYTLHYIYLKSRNKSAMVNGMEIQKNNKNGIHTNWNISKAFSLFNKLENIHKERLSLFFKNKNYRIQSYKADIALRYRPVNNIQWNIQYLFEDKSNILEDEKAQKHKVGATFQWSKLKNFNLRASVNFIHFRYPFPTNTSLAYTMLEGLKPGKNGTWDVTLQKGLYKNLQLNFHYHGRVSEKNKAIHSGQLELRANF